MLVLKRRIGESILIGRDVRIELREVRGCSAKLGIDAPPYVAVNRSEVVPPPQRPFTKLKQQILDAVLAWDGEGEPRFLEEFVSRVRPMPPFGSSAIGDDSEGV